MKFFVTLAILLVPLGLFAQQQQMSDEEQEKKLFENIEHEVENYTNTLDLEDWQVFYVDSILTHDYFAMRDELKELNRAKVSNVDLFMAARDRWNERIYQALGKVFNEEQWAKYLKAGAGKEKKSRDKREEKRNR